MERGIIVFTLHKCASMFIHEQSEHLSRQAGIDYISPNARNTDVDAERLLTDKDIWQDRHGCFAPIRFFVDVPNLDDYDVLLHLRDPRDVLVSMFYSYCFSHGGPVPGNTGHRKETASRGIDEFVLNKISPRSLEYEGDYGTGAHIERFAGNIHDRYRTYVERLLERPNVTLIKYEEMVSEYPSWLAKFMRPFPVEDKDSIYRGLVDRSPFKTPRKSEDIKSHVRRVTPGDYKEKLNPSTIDALNSAFAAELQALGYSVG